MVELSSTASPINACSTRKTAAAGTLTCPEAIGRERVRSTRRSRSRSTMSFQVQPAPRIAKAPTKNSKTCHASTSRLRPLRRALPTTSRATATATSRSGGRGGRGADRGATTRARGRRPSCRSNRRRVRRRRSSRQWIARKRVEGADTALGCGRLRDGQEWCLAHRSGSDRSAGRPVPPPRTLACRSSRPGRARP